MICAAISQDFLSHFIDSHIMKHFSLSTHSLSPSWFVNSLYCLSTFNLDLLSNIENTFCSVVAVYRASNFFGIGVVHVVVVLG